jgi:tRNA A-37 threonylcarbamoyl transferase component Bud32
MVHLAGYVYNDLKMENIMIENTGKDELRVLLIDYGYATKYKYQDGEHL